MIAKSPEPESMMGVDWMGSYLLAEKWKLYSSEWAEVVLLTFLMYRHLNIWGSDTERSNRGKSCRLSPYTEAISILEPGLCGKLGSNGSNYYFSMGFLLPRKWTINITVQTASVLKFRIYVTHTSEMCCYRPFLTKPVTPLEEMHLM